MSSPENRDSLTSGDDTEIIKKSIKVLESELQEALEGLEQATVRVNNLRKRLQEHRALVAPIRKLPVELLSQVFLSASYMEDLAPVRIIPVCRRWRRVILATSQAWSRIWFDNDLAPERSHRYISTFLERSNPAPLHIRLPDEFDPSYYLTGFSLHSNLFGNLHRIQCFTASGWQMAHLNIVTFPNVTQLSFTKAGGEFKPSHIDIARFPKLEAIDSLCISWVRLPTLSPDWFPHLQRLSISVDGNGAWAEVIRCCSSTLKALIVWGRQDYDTSSTFTADLPVLKSLEILDFPYNSPWSNQIATPSLVSYKETRIHADQFIPSGLAIGSHADVATVTHLRTDLIPTLSHYPALQVLGLQIASASLLVDQLTKNPQTCPFLEEIELIFVDCIPQADVPDPEREIREAMRDAKRNLKLTVTTERLFDMPFDLCDDDLPCYPESSRRTIPLLK